MGTEPVRRPGEPLREKVSSKNERGRAWGGERNARDRYINVVGLDVQGGSDPNKNRDPTPTQV